MNNPNLQGIEGYGEARTRRPRFENFFINGPTLSTAVLVELDGTVAALAENKKKGRRRLWSIVDPVAVLEQKVGIYDLA